MKTRFLIATALLLFSAVACSKDDDDFDPVGTVTLNMLDAANGRTLMGDMNVWIDNAQNFTCSGCSIAEIGPVGGLSAIDRPVLVNLAPKAAVKTGCGYAVYLERDLLEFPSGAYALRAGATYYRVRVESLIGQADAEGRQTIGACVKYLTATADRGPLPEPGTIEDMGSSYGYWLMDFDAGDYDEIMVDEPFEWSPAGEDGKGIYIWRPSTGSYDFQHYGLYMRKGTSWSCIWLKVR